MDHGNDAPALRRTLISRGAEFNQWMGLVVVMALCLGVGILGAISTRQSLVDWYPTLSKPAWNPPGWVFGPVWTVLYAMMGVAVRLVWRANGKHRQVALVLFALQLALNAIWSPLFFGMRNPLLALVDILMLWLAIVVTTISFYRSSRVASFLMLPYLVWVSFASTLNFEIWRMNS